MIHLMSNRFLFHVLLALAAIAPLAAQTFTFTKVADTATPVPNGTGNFATFSNMLSVDASGNVAFVESNGTTNNGIYLSSTGVLTRVADLNTTIPGGTGNFTSFAAFGNAIEAGRLAFRGNGSISQAGIYALVSGNLVRIADTSTAIPDGTGNFTSFTTSYVDGTNYAFIGPGSASQQGIYVSNGTTVTRIADKTSAVPGIGGTYSWSSQLGFDAGNIAFWANITGGTSPGTIVGGHTSGGGLVTLATTATAVPGAGTNFTSFVSPVDLSSTTVAFRGNYTGGMGIFTGNLVGGAITTIASLSDAVPGGSGNFTQVQNPSINSSGVAFHGTFTGGSGIYFHQNAVLQKVISTTDLLDGKAITFLAISENSLADGYLAFRANFADGSVGIYRTPVAANSAAGFSAWQQAKFTLSELADISKSGPNAIYGADGLTNLLKYSLGLEPKQNVSSGLPTLSKTPTEWLYTYLRPSQTTDVSYAVEISPNLTNWTTTGVTHEFITSSGGIETWRGRYPVSTATPLFFRLKTTLIP